MVKLTLAATIGLVICGISAGLGAYQGILASTPEIRLSDVVASGEATIVYDCEGNEIDQYVSINSNRIQINNMDLIPEHLGQAFVALEDKRFYQNNGIDIEGIARSGWRFITTLGKAKEGASTITQQLLKNTIFTTWTEENGNLIKMIKRKLQEQYLALEIAKNFSKEEILLRYMNAINLGQNTLGVESASQRYFGKSCSALTLSESAVIASITQNPSGLNPIRYPEENAKRRKKCLNEMLELEFITQEEYDEAMDDTEAVYERIQQHDADFRVSTNTTSGSYFSDALFEQVLDDLINVAGYSEVMAESLIYAGGLRIESTMDPAIQAIADEEFSNPDNYPENVKWYLNYALTIFSADGEKHNFSKENMMSWFKANMDKKFNLIFSSQDDAQEAIANYRSAMLSDLGVADDEDNYAETISMSPQPQAAMVIEDQSTGYVVAIVGGRGIKEGRRTLNRATNAKRSPGSTFKVVAVYAPALDSAGLTLATMVNDAPFNYANGRPVNNWYSGYRGMNSLRKGIIDSMNIIAVKTLTMITPQLGYDYIRNFGFTTVVDRKEITVNGEVQVFSDIQQSLALGGITDGVTNEELNASYATIANGGTYIKPKLYTKVIDHDGNVILDNTQPNSRQVIKETTAWLLTDAMMDVVTQGTGTSVNFGNMAIAGKTGTTSDYNDLWFTGYTPYYTATVWTGYDNNTKMRKGEERSLAKKLWRATMARIHEELPSASFQMPSSGIVQATVCARSGKLPIAGLCDGVLKSEYFAEGTVPTESCDVHYQGMICQYTNLPASEPCPFKVGGVLELMPIEHPALQQSASVTQQITNPDGTVSNIAVPQNQTNTCPHTIEFMTQPGVEGIVEQQRLEIEAAIQAQAAAQAAASQPEGAPAPPPDDSNGAAE